MQSTSVNKNTLSVPGCPNTGKQAYHLISFFFFFSFMVSNFKSILK